MSWDWYRGRGFVVSGSRRFLYDTLLSGAVVRRYQIGVWQIPSRFFFGAEPVRTDVGGCVAESRDLRLAGGTHVQLRGLGWDWIQLLLFLRRRLRVEVRFFLGSECLTRAYEFSCYPQPVDICPNDKGCRLCNAIDLFFVASWHNYLYQECKVLESNFSTFLFDSGTW